MCVDMFDLAFAWSAQVVSDIYFTIGSAAGFNQTAVVGELAAIDKRSNLSDKFEVEIDRCSE